MNSKLIRKILFIVVVLSVAYVFVSMLIREWDTFREWQFEFSLLPLLFSALFWILAVFWYGVLWRELINLVHFPNSLTLWSAIRTSTYTWLGRYTPGKAVSFIGRVYMDEGDTPRQALHLANAIGIMYGILSPVLLSVAFLLISGVGESFLIPLIVLGCIGIILIVLLDSPYPYKIIRYFKRLRGVEETGVPLSHRPIGFLTHAKFVGKYGISDILRGMGFVMLVFSFVPIEFSSSNVFFLAGAFTLAVIIGILSIITPAGVGVREGALVFLLSSIMPPEIAVAVALVQRAWELVIDGLILLFMHFLSQHKTI